MCKRLTVASLVCIRKASPYYNQCNVLKSLKTAGGDFIFLLFSTRKGKEERELLCPPWDKVIHEREFRCPVVNKQTKKQEQKIKEINQNYSSGKETSSSAVSNCHDNKFN